MQVHLEQWKRMLLSFGTHNIEIIPEITVEALEKLPTPRLAFIVAQESTIENDIVTLLKVNPKIKLLFIH